MSSIYEDAKQWWYCPDPPDYEPDNERVDEEEYIDPQFVHERDSLEGSTYQVHICRYPEEFGAKITVLSSGIWYRKRIPNE